LPHLAVRFFSGNGQSRVRGSRSEGRGFNPHSIPDENGAKAMPG